MPICTGLTACFAFGDRMNDHMVGIFRYFQGVSLQTAHGFATRFTLTFYLFEYIRRWQFAAIATILIDQIFQYFLFYPKFGNPCGLFISD